MSIPAAAVRRLDVNGLRAQHSVEQAREPRVEVLAPQLGHLRRPLALLADHAGLAEGPEVMGHRRLAEVEVEGAARARLGVLVEAPDDLQPVRVAEGVQDGRQLDLASLGVVWLHAHQLSLYDICRTTLVRCSSYYQTGAEATDMPDTQTLEIQSSAGRPEHE